MNTYAQPSARPISGLFGRVLKQTLFAVTVIGICSTSLHAGILLDISTTQPDEFVMAEYSNVSGSVGYQWRNTVSNGRRDLGQSFRAETSFDLAIFSLHSTGNIQVDARDQPYTLTVWESNAVTSMGSIISTQAGTWFGATAPSASGNWVSFELEDAVGLTEDKFYTVMLSWNTLGPSHVWSQNSTGPGGNIWQSLNGVDYTSITSQDLLFTVQAIPEPGSLLLLVLGGLSAVVFARRRR